MSASVGAVTSVALKNFVNGEYAAAASDQVSEIVDPSTGEAYAQAPVSGPADVEAALRAAAGAFEGWRDTTPAERSLALLRMADARPAPGAGRAGAGGGGGGGAGRGGVLARGGGPQPGKAGGDHDAGGDPAAGGRDPVLRGRGAHPAGHVRGRVPGGAPLGAAPRAGRGLCAGHALELPDDDGRVEVRPGDRGGQPRCAEALRHPAGHHAA